MFLKNPSKLSNFLGKLSTVQNNLVLFFVVKEGCYLVDILWGQPIKLIQVASTSELLENQRNDLVFFKIIPSHFCRVSELSKIEYEKFGPKLKNGYFGDLIFQEIEFFEHVKYNFKTS